MRAAIPQPTRFERAAGLATAWWPGERLAEMDEPHAPMPYQPGPIAWIALLAVAAFVGCCAGMIWPLP
jgi:hypothetical protein